MDLELPLAHHGLFGGAACEAAKQSLGFEKQVPESIVKHCCMLNKFEGSPPLKPDGPYFSLSSGVKKIQKPQELLLLKGHGSKGR